ncbi:hypothetical protein CRENBAI_017260 [Crenichthys baileyi]|uniref:Uncharacterized protein n=1 Tax=Crenichthys baileyi TaxID=28760 RepID=A0AAV9R3D6_9TELE
MPGDSERANCKSEEKEMTEQHLVQTASSDHTEITAEAANVIKSEKEGEKLKGDMLQSEKRLPIGKVQTTVEDRLQPSLTDPSMFNALGHGKGQAGPAPLTEEVISGVDWLEGKHSDFKAFDRRHESVTQSVSWEALHLAGPSLLYSFVSTQ